MKKWTMLSVSDIGKRENNDDFVSTYTSKHNKRRFYAMVVCDGVGSFKNSGIAAEIVGCMSIDFATKFFKRRLSKGDISIHDGYNFFNVLNKLCFKNNKIESSENYKTTLALSIFTNKHLLAYWAGDSRIYVLDENAKLKCVTKDHHDNEGRILSYFDSCGTIYGKLDFEFISLPANFGCIVLTTDGVHEYCTISELEQFVYYCIYAHLNSNDSLLQETKAFLSQNISDNFSVALYYSNPKEILSKLNRRQ